MWTGTSTPRRIFPPTAAGGSSTSPAAARAAQGIDVSFYQGEIDWQAVADSGVEFA